MRSHYHFRSVILISVIALAVLGILVVRGLYADGSYFLYQLLSTGTFANIEPHRKFSQALTQVPTWLAMNLGVTDLNLLIRLHSVGNCAMAVLVWAVALILQLRSPLFWVFVFGFSVTYLSFGFFAHGEANITCAMVALASSIVLRERFVWPLGILLLAATTLLLYGYETVVGLGPILLIFVVGRLVLVHADSVRIKITLCATAVLLIWAIRNAIWTLLYSGIQNMDSALNLGGLKSSHFIYICVLATTILVAYFTNNIKLKKVIACVGLGVSAFYVLSPKLWNPPFMMYSFRVLASPVLLGTLIAAGWIAWYETFRSAKSRRWAVDSYVEVLVVAVFLTLAVPFVHANLGFAKWGQRFESEAVLLTENTPIEQTKINTDHGWNSGFNWMWTNPSLSILLRGNAEAVILNNSGHTGWQPFDPEKIDRYPLKRFSKSGTLY